MSPVAALIGEIKRLLLLYLVIKTFLPAIGLPSWGASFHLLAMLAKLRRYSPHGGLMSVELE